MSRTIQAIVFDLDGTLANTIGDLRTAMNEMLTARGYPPRTMEQMLAAINNGARNLVARSLPADKRDDEAEVDRCLRAYNECYGRHYLDSTSLYDGMESLCRSLASDGIKMAVLSNKQHEQTAAIVERLLGGGLFGIVMGHRDLPHKPDPTAPLYIAKRLGVKPEETIFCGDSNVDMTTAHNAGMLAVGVTWGYRSRELLEEAGAAYIVDTPGALRELIADLNRST